MADLIEESWRWSLDLEESSRTEEAQINWDMHYFPSRVAIFVIRNIAPSADRSCSSGMNGSDPEQMSERQRMKTFPECSRHLEYCFDCEIFYPQIDQTCKHIKGTRKSSTYIC